MSKATNYGYALPALAAMLAEGSEGGQSYLCSMLKTESEPPRSKPNPGQIGVDALHFSEFGLRSLQNAISSWERVRDRKDGQLNEEAMAHCVDLAAESPGCVSLSTKVRKITISQNPPCVRTS